jgi:hypothetical protein
MSFLQITNLEELLNLSKTTNLPSNPVLMNDGIVISNSGNLSSIPKIDTSNLSTTLQTRLSTIETNISNLGTNVNSLSSINDGIVTSTNGILSSISKIDTTNLSTTLQTRLSTIDSKITNLDASLNSLGGGDSGPDILSYNFITLDDAAKLIKSVSVTNITNFASNWAQLTNSPTDNGVGIGASNNGQYILKLGWGASCYLSNDYGNTWNVVSALGSYQWTASMSDNGQYMLVTSIVGGATLSNNFGVTWSGLPAANDGKVSSTGRYMVLATNSGISYSSNFGQSFTNWTDSGVNTWNSVAISADGSTAVAVRATSPVTIWKTTNFGANWSQIYSNPSSVPFGNISCSSDAKYILLALTQGSSGKMYLSSNYGTSFSPLGTGTGNGLSDANYFKVAMSASGRYMAVACNSGFVFYSQNYGSTWVQSPLSSSGYYGICMSDNADFIYVYSPGAKILCFNSNITSISTLQPNNPGKGSMYFDESTNKFWVYNSTTSAWKSVTLA